MWYTCMQPQTGYSQEEKTTVIGDLNTQVGKEIQEGD